MNWGLVEGWLQKFGAYGIFISVITGLFVFFAYVFRPKVEESVRERIFPGLLIGFAAGHIPAGLLLILAALDPQYISYLKHQRIQMGLAGGVLLAFVVAEIRKGFREE